MQSKNSLLKKVFNTQIKLPSKGDWVSDISKTLKELDINKTFQELENMPKRNLSSMVKLAVEKHAFSYLIAIQKQKNKGKEIKYSQLSLQPYLRPRENISLNSKRKKIALRSKMNKILANFCTSSKIKICEKCNFKIDNYHLFKCTRNNINNITYDQILNETVLEQKNAIEYLNEIEDEEIP